MIKPSKPANNPDAIEQSLKQTASKALERAAASESQSGKASAMARFMKSMDGKLSSVLKEPEDQEYLSESEETNPKAE